VKIPSLEEYEQGVKPKAEVIASILSGIKREG
jgi:hypothetical protein